MLELKVSVLPIDQKEGQGVPDKEIVLASSLFFPIKKERGGSTIEVKEIDFNRCPEIDEELKKLNLRVLRAWLLEEMWDFDLAPYKRIAPGSYKHGTAKLVVLKFYQSKDSGGIFAYQHYLDSDSIKDAFELIHKLRTQDVQPDESFEQVAKDTRALIQKSISPEAKAHGEAQLDDIRRLVEAAQSGNREEAAKALKQILGTQEENVAKMEDILKKIYARPSWYTYLVPKFLKNFHPNKFSGKYK